MKQGNNQKDPAMKPPALPRNLSLQPRLPDNAAIKLIGLGGVGSILARYLVVFLTALGRDVRLLLVDGDEYVYANSTRVLFADYGNKAKVLRNELRPRCMNTNLSLVAVEEYVTPDNLDRLVRSGDICLLAVDNHATRKLVSDHCSGLAEICLISGGNDGVGRDGTGLSRRGTFGNVQAYVRRGGESLTPSLAEHHPEIATPLDRLPTDQSCTELVSATPQILFANLAVASAMLNTLWLYLCGALHYGELAFDIADGLTRPSLPLNHLIGPDAGSVRAGNAFTSPGTIPQGKDT